MQMLISRIWLPNNQDELITNVWSEEQQKRTNTRSFNSVCTTNYRSDHLKWAVNTEAFEVLISLTVYQLHAGFSTPSVQPISAGEDKEKHLTFP